MSLGPAGNTLSVQSRTPGHTGHLCPVIVLSPGPARSFCRAAFHTLDLSVCWSYSSLWGSLGTSLHWISQGFFHSQSTHIPLQHQPYSEPVTPPSFVHLWVSPVVQVILRDIKLGGAQCRALGYTPGEWLPNLCHQPQPPQPWYFSQFPTCLTLPLIWHKFHHPVCNNAMANSVQSFPEGEITATAVPLENHIHTFKPSSRVQICHWVHTGNDCLWTTWCLLSK